MTGANTRAELPIEEEAASMDTKKSSDAEEQAVLIKIPLNSGGFGISAERAPIGMLEDQLRSVLADYEVGQLDGDEFARGSCTVYLYGPSADSLADVVAAVARSNNLPAPELT